MKMITIASVLAVALLAGCLLTDDDSGSRDTVSAEASFQGDIVNLVDWSAGQTHDTILVMRCLYLDNFAYDGPCVGAHAHVGGEFRTDTTVFVSSRHDTLGAGIMTFPVFLREEDTTAALSGSDIELNSVQITGRDSTIIYYHLKNPKDTGRVDFYGLYEEDSDFYFGRKIYPGHPCTFSFAAEILIDFGPATVTVPLTFSSDSLLFFDSGEQVEFGAPERAYYLVIDEEASTPPVFSSVEFLNRRYQGTVSVTCPLP